MASATIINYEVGAKTEWLDGRLVLNAAAFIEQFEDLQVVGRIGPLSLPYFANVSSAETSGVELELGARPTDNLSINLAVTYTEHDQELPRLNGRIGSRAALTLVSRPCWDHADLQL